MTTYHVSLPADSMHTPAAPALPQLALGAGQAQGKSRQEPTQDWNPKQVASSSSLAGQNHQPGAWKAEEASP